MNRVFLVSIAAFIAVQLPAQLKTFEKEIDRSEKMNFLLYSPLDHQDSYPLVVFLHGGGESGNDIELVKKHGIPKLIGQGRNFPFYVFAPQNPYKKGLWDDRMVDEMVDKLVDSLNIDTRRIYLVGMSRGGDGVWRMSVNHPNKYAALISICAASIPNIYLKLVNNLPVWFFHGEQDNVVPVEQTKVAYEILKAINPDVRLTLYPDADHDSWTETFENNEIYDWLLSHELETAISN